MSNPVISVQNLSKLYRIGAKEDSNKTFREAIIDGLTAPIRNFRRLRKLTNFDDSKTKRNSPNAIRSATYPMPSAEEDVIWALKDVSFEVQPGEVVGIIGRNGAGKTTLLKILSRITEPSEGTVDLTGRVSSLLEVGTGFHPELTGRENIFLNGAILGMSKKEIKEKFDEIVNFSEIEKFIDTPVKRYSSGMYVRLAFAVASYLEPEILLVDEVLAVGDADFQKKCLGKIGDVAKQGRAVLFVSHNMTAIKALCNRAILLQEGRLLDDGDTSHMVNTYLNSGRISKAEVIWNDPAKAPGNELFRLHSVRVRGVDEIVTSEIESQHPFDIEIEYWNLSAGSRLGATIVLYNQEGICVFGSLSNHEKKWHNRPHPEGLFRSKCRIPSNLLADGHFSVSVLLWADNYKSIHREDQIVELDVHEVKGARGSYLGHMDGVIRPLLQWNTELLTTL